MKSRLPNIDSINIKNILSKGKYFTKNIWDIAKREKKETTQALSILQRMLGGEKVSDKEKLFLKRQSGDLAKLIPLIVIQGIPVPIPIIPLLIILGNKYGFSILPKSQEILSKEIEDENNKSKSI